MSETRILVCGGTDYNDVDQLHETLTKLHRARPFRVLIEGEARGADQLARNWAQLHGIEVDAYHADWDLFGPRAGSIRNSRQLREGKPNLAVAFPGNRGTADMVKKLKAASVPTLVGRWSAGPNSKIIWTPSWQ